jgi:hypothetical protein
MMMKDYEFGGGMTEIASRVLAFMLLMVTCGASANDCFTLYSKPGAGSECLIFRRLKQPRRKSLLIVVTGNLGIQAG